MNNNVHIIDYSKLVQWLSPHRIRNERMTAWLTVLISPVITLYQDYRRFRDQKLYELSITPQVCYLQKLLNDRFDNVDRRITIVDGEDKPPTYLFVNAELKPLYIRTVAEAQPVYIYTDGESGDLSDDFIIRVPAAITFNEAEMKSLVKVYKLAGTKFKIQII